MKQLGFTIIEGMIVAAIFMILAAMFIPPLQKHAERVKSAHPPIMEMNEWCEKTKQIVKDRNIYIDTGGLCK